MLPRVVGSFPPISSRLIMSMRIASTRTRRPKQMTWTTIISSPSSASSCCSCAEGRGRAMLHASAAPAIGKTQGTDHGLLRSGVKSRGIWSRLPGGAIMLATSVRFSRFASSKPPDRNRPKSLPRPEQTTACPSIRTLSGRSLLPCCFQNEASNFSGVGNKRDMA